MKILMTCIKFQMKMLKSIICWNLSHMKPISFRCLTYTIPGLDVFEQGRAFTSTLYHSFDVDQHVVFRSSSVR